MLESKFEFLLFNERFDLLAISHKVIFEKNLEMRVMMQKLLVLNKKNGKGIRRIFKVHSFHTCQMQIKFHEF